MTCGGRRNVGGSRRFISKAGQVTYLHVSEVSLDAADHLGFLKHFLGIGHGGRLFAPLDRGRREVVPVVVDGATGHTGSGRQLIHGHHGGRRGLSAQLEHREQVVGGRAHVREGADLLGDHAQLLKVDESVDARVVAQVDERQILFDDGEEWNLTGAKMTK